MPMDQSAIDQLLSTASDDVLLDAKSLLARAIVETHVTLPQDSVKCLVFLVLSGRQDVADLYLSYRRYLSPGIPESLSKVIRALALEEYMSRINISLGGK